ncbi:hypothetical protein FGO68_gene14767 [Halteria grandinella]|uniref:Uncharacterized protein n=1 Tax=Halteria grandinella TaxID=5974 RepID=A0A8J8T7J8_HALGN|nr:hypothetical protein FGO68_gene14767 [Halteria grandinella]
MDQSMHISLVLQPPKISKQQVKQQQVQIDYEKIEKSLKEFADTRNQIRIATSRSKSRSKSRNLQNNASFYNDSEEDIDYIDINKICSQHWSDLKSRKLQVLGASINSRIQQAIEKKEFLIEQQRQKILDSVQKWESIKFKKRQEAPILAMQKLQRAMCKEFLKILFTSKVLLKMKKDFEAVKAREILKAERIKVGWKFYRLFVRRISKNGKQLAQRMKQQIKFCLTTSFTSEIINQRAHSLIKVFLFEAGTVFTLRKKIDKTLKTVIRLQRGFRSLRTERNARIAMLNYYWETMKVDVSKMLLTNATSKFQEAAKTSSITVFAVDQHKRQKYIQAYAQYCRETFYLRFLKWRQLRLDYYGKAERIDFDDDMINVKSSVKRLEFMLFDNLDPVAAEILNQPIKSRREKVDQRRMTKLNFNGVFLNLQETEPEAPKQPPQMPDNPFQRSMSLKKQSSISKKEKLVEHQMIGGPIESPKGSKYNILTPRGRTGTVFKPITQLTGTQQQKKNSNLEFFKMMRQIHQEIQREELEEEQAKSLRESDESDDQRELPPPPVNKFLPSKAQLIKMILKAAFTKD